MKRSEALKLRKLIERFAETAKVDTKTAYDGRSLFAEKRGDEDFWDGHLIESGKRIRWDGNIMSAANELWAYPGNDPDHAPNLWELIKYKNGYRVLTGPITVSNPVQPGERCWENDVLYECVAQTATTYRPSEYALYWEAVSE